MTEAGWGALTATQPYVTQPYVITITAVQLKFARVWTAIRLVCVWLAMTATALLQC